MALQARVRTLLSLTRSASRPRWDPGQPGTSAQGQVETAPRRCQSGPSAAEKPGMLP